MEKLRNGNASHLPLGERTITKESPEKLREALLLCPEYNKLYQDIISVGEFNIQ